MVEGLIAAPMLHLKRRETSDHIYSFKEVGIGHLHNATVTATEWEKLCQWYIANGTWKSKSWGWQD